MPTLIALGRPVVGYALGLYPAVVIVVGSDRRGEPIKKLVEFRCADVRLHKDPSQALLLGLITEGRFPPQDVANNPTCASRVVSACSSALGAALHRDVT
eukprot:3416293-Pyramimonas_sp.AAC.1